MFRLALSLLLVLCLLRNDVHAQEDWRMWGHSPSRNNVVAGVDIPTQWDIGRLDRKTGKWDGTRNIKWAFPLGSQAYGNPVVADGKVFVGSNNGAGHLKRYPYKIDLGVLLCIRESDGKFLWQHSNEKLPTGRVHDWEQQGVCSTPLVEGKRLWYTSNRGEVVCLDTEGFYDEQDDEPDKENWERLFTTYRHLSAALNAHKIPPRLEQAIKGQGIYISYASHVDPSEGGKGPWTIKNNAGSYLRYLPKCEIRLVDRKLQVFKLSNDKPPRATRRLLSIEDDSFPSLQTAKELGKPLRDLIAKRGFVLPDEVKLENIERDKRWKLSAIVDGVPRDFNFTVEGPRFTCRFLITTADKHEADVIWRFNLMEKLDVSQHNMATCSPLTYGDTLFICTSNGVDETHIKLPRPDAPAFIALDKNTGKLLWSDNSPGKNILHGQWASPAIGVLGRVPQVLFPGGDGWLYSFRADKWDKENKKPILLWKFDGNHKRNRWVLGGRGRRNNMVSFPVIHNGLVYMPMGQDPEHGEGIGDLWCIDPTRRGDVSPELAMKRVGEKLVPIPHHRIQAVDETKGEVAVPNPNSAVIWHYSEFDRNGNGRFEFEETFHRSVGSPVIKDGLLMIGDFSGLVHCVDAQTGKPLWTHDCLAAAWSTGMIVGDKYYIGDEDGDLSIFELSRKHNEPLEYNMDNSIYTAPVVANNVLYISNRSYLFAIEHDDR